jgi:hypothetical protein
MDSDERAVEREVHIRAMRHDCVLYANASVDGNDERVVFTWRSSGEQVGPEFADRDRAVEWMSQRLGDDEGSTDVRS